MSELPPPPPALFEWCRNHLDLPGCVRILAGEPEQLGLLKSLLTVATIAWLAAAALAIIWIRTWVRYRREKRADEQVRLEQLHRRGWRELQRRKLLDRELHR